MKPNGFGVHLKVQDITASKKFYDSLGLQAVFGMGSDEFRATVEGADTVPENYNGLIYDIGGAKLEIADGHVGVKNQGVFNDTIPTEKISAMINVESLVPLFGNDLVELTFPVRKYHWGTIEAAFRDPDGFVIVLIAQATDEEFAAVSKLTNVEVTESESSNE